jgi:hypothetical protein
MVRCHCHSFTFHSLLCVSFLLSIFASVHGRASQTQNSKAKVRRQVTLLFPHRFSEQRA